MNLPEDICNQALDAAGVEYTLGNMEDGSRPAQVLLRAYRQCLMQLLRAAHWDFARKTAPLVLLADATGNTANVGTLVPVNWTYEYEYPIDCMKARFVPWNYQNINGGIPPNNIQTPQVPLMTGLGSPPSSLLAIRPARFTIATDYNYPPPAGSITWEVQGVSPASRTVILTNAQNAQLVYTSLILYPSIWDPLFRAAFVSYLASEIALPLWVSKDKNFGLKIRGEQIKIATQKIVQARLTDGNEGWYSSDISVDWMRFRSSYGSSGWGAWGAGQAGPGCLGYGWDSIGFADGSAY